MRNLKTRVASLGMLAMLVVATMSTIGIEAASAGNKKGKKSRGGNTSLRVKAGRGGNNSVSNNVTVRGGDASNDVDCKIRQTNVGVVAGGIFGGGTVSATNTCGANVATGGDVTGPVTIGPAPDPDPFPCPPFCEIPLFQGKGRDGINVTQQANGNAGNG